VIGSLIGGVGLYYIARRGGEAYLKKFTSDGRGQKLKFWFLEYGLLTVFIPALVIVPMPLKVAEICAGALGVRPMPFTMTLIAARIPRYFGLAYLGAKLGEGSWPWVKAHAWHMGWFALGLFAVLYLMILVVHVNRKRVS
jgi:membrane protein DedA with SNARE-associated domain